MNDHAFMKSVVSTFTQVFQSYKILIKSLFMSVFVNNLLRI